MRLAVPFVALVAVTVYAMPASAGRAGADPLNMVLQRSDFPGKTRWQKQRDASVEKSLAAAGFRARAAYYSAEITRGSTDTLLVNGRVIVLASAADASRVFDQFKRDVALDLKVAKTVQLPAYGDEQSAFTQLQPGVRADLRVRKGAVVWRLEIKWASTERHTRAQTLAELKTYAPKQRQRVVGG